MKILKWIINLFNFKGRYGVKEAKYHAASKKFGSSGIIIESILLAAVPPLCVWGAFRLPWEELLGVVKLGCIIGCLTVFHIFAELIINGMIAFRHSIRMKIQNKLDSAAMAKTTEIVYEGLSGEEMSDEGKEALKEKQSERKSKGTNHKYDIAAGIICIILAVAQLIATLALLMHFFSTL